MNASLPSFFAFEPAADLVRIGRDYDGGYLVSQADIFQSNILLGLGINDDWSFETDFVAIHKVPVIAYDASVNEKKFLKQFIQYLPRLNKWKVIWRRYKVYRSYRNFFVTGPNTHIQKFVGLNSKNPTYCTLEDILSETDSSKIFLKIDIEGSEYRFLTTLLDCANRITGLVIELHDCDLHLTQIEHFIKNFDLRLVHVHANNFGPIRAGDELPVTLELTFSKYAKHVEKMDLPHRLDMPNNRSTNEIILKIL
jgi:hypothetical protein|tara:strand:+ start:1091 stop:1849 length:759 start_codon:yes stop_codon:yes gene_type:complete